MLFLGIDTSNYACSVAIYDSTGNSFAANERIDLPVKKGELGLRQNEAVFEHTKLLPILFGRTSISDKLNSIAAVAVSAAPTGEPGSYMPCFLAGLSVATAVSVALGVPLYRTNHQAGHIMAAVHSCRSDKLDRGKFYAVHLSGGTTDLLCCNTLFAMPEVMPVSSSSDLHAGQCVDRIGRMLGIEFPAGKMLSALAANAPYTIKPRCSMLACGKCSISGLQNQCEQMFNAGEEKSVIARYCLESIAETVLGIVKANCNDSLPVLMSGGVSSSDIIKSYLSDRDARFLFAEPDFCRDNAAGTAILASRLKGENF